MSNDNPPSTSEPQGQLAVPGRQVIERLQTLLASLDQIDLPQGETGRDFLDALELCDLLNIVAYYGGINA